MLSSAHCYTTLLLLIAVISVYCTPLDEEEYIKDNDDSNDIMVMTYTAYIVIYYYMYLLLGYDVFL